MSGCRALIVGFLVVSAVLTNAVPYESESFIGDVSGRKTGFFHVEEDADGRAWVIDPLGRGYYPFGIAHCRIWQTGYDFKERNLKRCGSEEAWTDETLARLKDWHFNCFDSWWPKGGLRKGLSHIIFPWMGQPFAFDPKRPDRCLVLRGTGHTPGSCFPNVFHPDWKDYCRDIARRAIAPHRDDPWVLGYFSDNELAWWGEWGSNADIGLYDAVKKLPSDHSGRQALEAFTAQHRGEWDETKLKREFLRLVAEKYFDGTVGAIREADPNHMVFGCRFAGFNSLPDEVWETAGRYLDIVSFNCYAWADIDRNQVFTRASSETTLADRLARIHRATRKPLILTEWSYVAVDSGVPCTWGAGQVFKTQSQRARAVTLYARTVMAQPFVAGYCYFMWADQPPGGVSATFRENSNFGLVNHDGVPYPEITAALQRVQSDPGRWHRASVPEPRVVAFECMPQTSAAFWTNVVRQTKADRAPVVKVAKGGSSVSFLREGRREGVLRPLVQFSVNGTNSFACSMSVADVRESTSSFGEKSKLVVFEGENLGRRHRTTLEVVPFADRSRTLVSLVKVENIGDLPMWIKEFHFSLFPCFDAETAYNWSKQVKRLWGEPRRFGWKSKDGTRRVDVESFSFAISSRARFWKGKGGDLHPDAIFTPPKQFELEPGATWTPPAGHFYVSVSAEPDSAETQPAKPCGERVTDFNFSDPTIWQASDGRYLALASGMDRLLVSDDLFRWRDAGFPIVTPETYARLSSETIGDRDWTAGKGLWAPDVTKVGTNWILTVTLRKSYKDSRIVSLVADAPEGPFRDPRLLTSGLQTRIGDSIDPEVVRDGDRTFLFFGSVGGIHCIELAADARNPLPDAKPVHVAGLKADFDMKGFQPGRHDMYEGSYVFHRNGWWYLFASGGYYRDWTYRIVVGRSKSVLGPYVDRKGRPMTEGHSETILRSGEHDRFFGPGHNGEIVERDGKSWMAFHVHDREIPYEGSYIPRPMMVQELRWDAEGWPFFAHSK